MASPDPSPADEPRDDATPVEGDRPGKRGRKPGRTRHTRSVSLDDAAYDRIMRAVSAEGLEFSAFMEKAGLRLVDLLEERRGEPYPTVLPTKNVLDDI